MTILHLVPVILSCLLLTAHFLFIGLVPVSWFFLALPLLLFQKSTCVRRVFITVLTLGGLLWLTIAWERAGLRMATGQPYLRLMIILVSVALLNFLGVFLLTRARLKRVYGGGGD
jgi:hypothetical protein